MRRAAWSLVAVVVAAAASLVVAVSPAFADNGLRIEAASTFDARPRDGVVKVTVNVTVTNETTDQVQGGIVRRQFFNALSVPVAAQATNIVAQAEAGPLASPLVPINDFVARVDVSFPNLFAGQSRSFVLTYDIASAKPRSSSVVRINPAYVSFLVIATGDAGLGSVRVVVPNDFQVDNPPTTVRRTIEGSSIVYSATAIDKPAQFGFLVSARNDTALNRLDADVGTADILVRAWPGDDEWAKFTATQVQRGIPALEKLIGRPWPLTTQLKVVEATTPYLRGYSGWFAPTTSTIEVGELLDAETMLHELSHAWFNRDLFSDRWTNEGFAETYASKVAQDLGAKPAPAKAPTSAKFKLTTWAQPTGQPQDIAASETYGYETSYWVVSQLVTEIGFERLAAVIAAARDGVPAYGPGQPHEFGDAATASRRLLDLIDNIGKSQKADNLFATYVLNEPASLLDQRSTARRAYDELAAAAGAWQLPVLVRRSMGEWRFDEATAGMAAARDVVATRNQIAARAGSFGATPSDTVERSFEAADRDLTETVRLAADQLDAAQAVATGSEQVHRSRNIVEKIGLLFDHPSRRIERARVAFERDDFDGARAAAGEATDLVDGASAAGARRLAVVVVLVAGALAVVIVSRRRRPVRDDGLPGDAMPDDVEEVTPV